MAEHIFYICKTQMNPTRSFDNLLCVLVADANENSADPRVQRCSEMMADHFLSVHRIKTNLNDCLYVAELANNKKYMKKLTNMGAVCFQSRKPMTNFSIESRKGKTIIK